MIGHAFSTVNSAEVMKHANAAFEKAGITLEELRKRMGPDPRLSMLLRFCEAMETSISDLCDRKRKSRSK